MKKKKKKIHNNYTLHIFLIIILIVFIISVFISINIDYIMSLIELNNDSNDPNVVNKYGESTGYSERHGN